MKSVTVTDTKAKFFQTLVSAKETPVVVTYRDKPRSVIMSYKPFQAIIREKRSG